MNFKAVLVLSMVVAGFAGVSGVALAYPGPQRCWCEYKGGEGHEVPSPFSNTNQVVELADGEAYTLIGKVVFMGKIAYLNVNLDLHPWLATTRRKAFPFYRLIGNPSIFKDLEQKEVKVLAQAQIELSPASTGGQKFSSAAAADADAAVGYVFALSPSPTIPIQVLDGDADSEWNR